MSKTINPFDLAVFTRHAIANHKPIARQVAIEDRLYDYLETEEYCYIVHNGKTYAFRFELRVNNKLQNKFHAPLMKMIDESTSLTVSPNTSYNQAGQNITGLFVIPAKNATEYFCLEGKNSALQLLGYDIYEINKAAEDLKLNFVVRKHWAPEITRKAGVFVGGTTTDLTLFKMKLG